MDKIKTQRDTEKKGCGKKTTNKGNKERKKNINQQIKNFRKTLNNDYYYYLIIPCKIIGLFCYT